MLDQFFLDNGDDLVSWLLLQGDNLQDDEFNIVSNQFNENSNQFEFLANETSTSNNVTNYYSSFAHQGSDPLYFLNNSGVAKNFISNKFMDQKPPKIRKTISASNLSTMSSYDEIDGDSDSSEENVKLRNKSNTSTIGKKRSKVTIDDLEKRVCSLQEENNDLKAHLENVNKKTNEFKKQRTMIENLMEQLANSAYDSESMSKLHTLLEQYVETYADYGKCRQKEATFHLNQLEKLVIPTQTTKMVLWAVQQDKSFIKTPLFNILSSNIDATEDQIKRIQDRREKVQLLISKLREALNVIKELRCTIVSRQKALDNRLAELRKIATPKQTVQLLSWITRNYDELSKHLPKSTKEQSTDK